MKRGNAESKGDFLYIFLKYINFYKKRTIRINYIKCLQDRKEVLTKPKLIIAKRYILDKEILENKINIREIKIIKLEEKESNLNLDELFKIFDKNLIVAILFIVMNYKIVGEDIEKRNKLSLVFKNYFENFKRIENITNVFQGINVISEFWTIQICSLIIYSGGKNKLILEVYMKNLMNYKGIGKYSYLINAFFYNYIEKVEDYGGFNLDVIKIIKQLCIEYNIDIIVERKNTSEKK